MNLIDVAKQFSTPEACNDFLEQMRWPDGLACIHCGSKRVSKYVKQESTRIRKNRKTGKLEKKTVPARILYVCLDCKKQFSVGEGTIFNDTHLSLEKWFHAVALMVNAKNGISAKQIQRDLGVAYKTAWYLDHRIRKAMMLADSVTATGPLTGTVEADETYIGGKYDKRRKRARYDKEPVFGIVERGGKARTYHVPAINRSTIMAKIATDVSIKADLLCTDESPIYKRVPDNIQKHAIVNHRAEEWVRGEVHTGTIDGYWGLLKRGIIGSFHQVSIKHLHRYLSEFQFRWNNRDSGNMFLLVVAALIIGTQLTYDTLIDKKLGIRDEPF